MDVVRTIAPGKKGSLRFLREWGKQLVNVRYRRDSDANEWVTTIEIIVDRRPIASPGTQARGYLAQRDQHAVALRIGYLEKELRHQIKQSGAKWSPQLGLWVVTRKVAVQMGLLDRMVEGAAEKCIDVDTSMF